MRQQTYTDAQRGDVRAGGTRLSYLELGEGPPLVLLHGFPQSPYCWRHQMPELARTHRVIAFDLKGYGASDKPDRGYDLGTLTEEMREALHNLGYERAAWAGHDWGGVLLWALALRYPETVERLAIINAPLHRLSPLRSSYVIPFSVPGLMERLLARGNDRFIRASLPSAAYLPEAFPEEALAEYARAFALPGVHRASLAWYRALWRSGPQRRWWLRKKVRPPCLVVWGIHDPALPVGLLKGMERHVAGPLEVVPVARCGHWVMEEQPERALALLARFFRGEQGA
jgi:pimeloyl-ACP methyl ester carboxylesterase